MQARMPPTEVRRVLRREVGFGCPVQGCRSPFLEYHHFNPPWHVGHTHNTDGMIALCSIHHNMADQGTWTIEELTKLKNSNREDLTRGKLHWNLRDSIVNAGSNYLIVQDSLSLRVLGNEIFGLSENENGQITLNALLWNNIGEVIIRIIDNDIFVAPNNINDFVCNASGNKIRIESIKNHTYLEFAIKRQKAENLIGNIRNFTHGAKEIPVINLKAKVMNPLFDIGIQNKNILIDFRKFGYDRTSLSNRIIGPTGSLNIIYNGREFIHLG